MTATQNAVTFTLNGTIVSNSCESFVLSKKYIRIMTEAAILNIICQRMNVDESVLECRKYEGVPYFVVNSKSRWQKDPRISQFLSWLKGIKNAINKNYLKVIYLFLLNPEKDILESYTLKFKYNTDPNNHSGEKRTPDYVKECTKTLLAAISLLSEQRKVNEDSSISIELQYNNGTPADYEPQNFGASSNAYCRRISQNTHLLGILSTGYHNLKAFSSQRPKTPALSASVVDIEESFSQRKRKITDNDNGGTGKIRILNTAYIDNPSRITISDQESSNSFFRKNEKYNQDNVNGTCDTSKSSASVDDIEESFSKRKRKITDNDNEETGKIRILDTAYIVNTSRITISDQESPDSFFRKSEEYNQENVNCICGITFSKIDLFKCVECQKLCHGPCYGLLCSKTPASLSCIDCDLASGAAKEENLIDKKINAFVRLVLYSYKKTGKVFKELDGMAEEDKLATIRKLKDCVVQKMSKRGLKKCKFEDIKINEAKAFETMPLVFLDDEADSARF